MLLSQYDKPTILKIQEGGVFEMHKMNTREKAVILQLLLSRNIMIEKWDAHRLTAKLVGLKGGMMNNPVLIEVDKAEMGILGNQAQIEENKGEVFNAANGF